MRIQVMFFARSRELAGTSTAEIEVQEGTTAQEAMDIIWKEFPALQEIRGSCVLALNQEYVDGQDTRQLRERDELAVIPPISGG